MNTSQTMNKFQPYPSSTLKLPKLPKLPKFLKPKKKLKSTCSSKDKIKEIESSSSSDDERIHNLTKALKKQQYDLLHYNTSSQSEDSCSEKRDKKKSYSKYHKLKQIVSRDVRPKKKNQTCEFDHDDVCDSKEIHCNEMQLRSAKDCCKSNKNECMQCECLQHTIKNSYNSTKSDCIPCKYMQREAINNSKICYNDNIACNSCCEHNESYNNCDCLSNIGSSINHYRSNNLMTNSHLLPRRYPASWTPLNGRSRSPTERIAQNVCTIKECNDHNESNDEFYEGNCNAIRGGVAQKSTPSYSQTSEVSVELLNKCGN